MINALVIPQCWYPLDADTIADKVEENRIGVYALMKMGEPKPLVYVGRSDNNVADRLRDHAREKTGGANMFWFHYCDTAMEAYEGEVYLYEEFGNSIRNQRTPTRP